MSNSKISVLFCNQDSIYKELGCDCWDIKRDALNFKGNNPVICHPPCRLWGTMRGLSTAPAEEKELALFAIDQVRNNGGVLEHPKRSKLFPDHLPVSGQTDIYGGYSICIDQSWFGHLARKQTLLYIVGIDKSDLPPIPIRFDMIEYVVSNTTAVKRGLKKELPKKMRSETPGDLAKWLVELAKRIDKINR